MDLVIRPALQSDAAFAAEMVQLSMGRLADYLFGANHQPVRRRIENLFARNAGRFGFGLSFVAESAGRMKGVLLSFKGAGIRRLNVATFPHLFPALGLREALRFMWRGILLPGGRETEADEYYISNLGVHPSAQGQGIGSALLKFAEERAHAEGLLKCSLVVGFSNQDAFRLYRRSGYQVVETVLDDNPTFAYHRMMKVL